MTGVTKYVLSCLGGACKRTLTVSWKEYLLLHMTNKLWVNYILYMRHIYDCFTGEMFIGFEIAVSSMKKGELSRFIIRPGYAYGKMGCSPRIPENAICKAY